MAEILNKEEDQQTTPKASGDPHQGLVKYFSDKYYQGKRAGAIRKVITSDRKKFDSALNEYYKEFYSDMDESIFREKYLSKNGDPFKQPEPAAIDNQPVTEVEPEKKKSLAEELSIPSAPGSQGGSLSPDGIDPNQNISPVVPPTPSDATRMVQTPELSEEQLMANREIAANQPEDVSLLTQEGFEKVASRTKPLAAIVRGVQMGRQADILTAGDKTLSEDELKELADVQKKLQDPRFKPSKAYERFTQAKGFIEGLTELSENYEKIIPELMAESMTALLNHGISRVLAGANIGAAAGTAAFPGPGTMIGAGAGAVAGLGLSDLNLEYSGSIMESLQEAGIDVSDAESLIKGFSDDSIMKEARSHAFKKGVPIALFDMMSMGMAGKIVSQPAKSLIGRAGQYSAELGMQSGMGMSGELAGQSIAGEEIQPGAILAEGVGELGPGVVETGIGKKVHSTPEKTVTAPKGPLGKETTKPQTNEKVEKPENPTPDTGDQPGVEQENGSKGTSAGMGGESNKQDGKGPSVQSDETKVEPKPKEDAEIKPDSKKTDQPSEGKGPSPDNSGSVIPTPKEGTVVSSKDEGKLPNDRKTTSNANTEGKQLESDSGNSEGKVTHYSEDNPGVYKKSVAPNMATYTDSEIEVEYNKKTGEATLAVKRKSGQEEFYIEEQVPDRYKSKFEEGLKKIKESEPTKTTESDQPKSQEERTILITKMNDDGTVSKQTREPANNPQDIKDDDRFFIDKQDDFWGIYDKESGARITTGKTRKDALESLGKLKSKSDFDKELAKGRERVKELGESTNPQYDRQIELSKEGKEKAKKEAERLNAEFEERQKQLAKDYNLSEEEVKAAAIEDKFKMQDDLTQEELDYINENYFRPEGYEFDKSGNLKETTKQPEPKVNLPQEEKTPTPETKKEEKVEENLPQEKAPTPEYTPESAYKDYKALREEGDNRGEAVAKVAKKYGQKYMKVDDELFRLERKDSNSKGGGSLKSRGATPIHSFEQRESKKLEDDAKGKLHEWAINIIRKYSPKSKILQKHTGRNALGLFFTKSKNIAIKGLTDISVAFHELSHSLDDQFGIIKNLDDSKLQEKLRKLYVQYYPGALSTHPRKLQHIEGYATLLQKFIETPDIIRNQYPELVREFLTPDGKHTFPEVTNFLDDANQMVEDYFNMNPLQQVGSRVVDESVPERPKGVTEKMTQVADRTAEEIADNISQLEALTRKDGSFYTSDDAAQMMRLANKNAIIASNNIQGNKGYWAFNEDGEWTQKYDYNWKTIHSKLVKRKKELGGSPEKAFGYWLVARRAYYDFLKLEDLHDQMDGAKKRLEEARAEENEKAIQSIQVTINNLKEDINKLTSIISEDKFSRPQVEKAYHIGKDIFKEEVEMYDNLMQEQRNLWAHPLVGIISKSDLAKMNENKGYTSFSRLMMDEITGEGIGEDVALNKKTGGLSVGSLKERTGSDKPIINPFLSGIASESEVTRKALQQATLNKIGKMADKHPDVFQQVPVEANYNETTKKASFPQERDPNYIVTRENGKRAAYLVGPEIRRVIDENFTYDNVHIIFKVAQAAARLFRAGTTGWWLPFLATNIQMDQITSAANSRTNMIPFFSSSKEMFSALTNKDSKERQWYNEYVWLANTSHTSGGWNKQSFRNLDVKFLDKSGKAKMVRYMERIADIITAPANYSEIMTRATEYIRARRMGYPQHIALEQAGRVSASFHHTGRLGGTTGREFIRSVPYANASIQVLAQMARSLRTETGQKRYAFVMAALAASSAASLVYSLDDKDEETKELYKSLTPEELANSIYVKSPHNSKLIKLRTPNNMTFFSVLINMAIMETYANANYTNEEWFKGATSGIPDVFKPYEGIKWLMSITPNLLKGGLEVGLNKKSFPEIRDIESVFDQRVPVEERYDTWTSPVAKTLGRTELAKNFKLSPKKIDHLIGAYGGRTAQLVTMKPNRLKLPATFERELYFNSSRQVQWFYEFKEKYEQLATQVRKEDAYDKYDSKFIDEVEDYIGDIKDVNALFDEYREIDELSEPKRAKKLQLEIFREIEKLRQKVN